MTTRLRPIERTDGYLPIADHGLIGDGETAALVGRDGAITWLCVPQFDDMPLFCGLLDAHRGGRFLVAPVDAAASRQYYTGETGVLVTELRGAAGTVRVTDALTLRSGADLREDVAAARGELVRRVEVLDGRPAVRVVVEPRAGGELEPRGSGWRLRCAARPDLDLQLDADRPLAGGTTELRLAPGERLHVVLRWTHVGRRSRLDDVDAVLATTVEAWERWGKCMRYDGPQPGLVRRAAITLKLLDHLENGAMVAAPTSSLPERIGGVRNWDYRYAWVRDVAFSVYALSRVGLEQESSGFLAWLLDVVEASGAARPSTLYTLDGRRGPPESTDPSLAGYRGSAPVRWGNAAADQRQNDVFGEVIDCAYLWANRGGAIDAPLWRRLRPLVEAARGAWQEPDHGIWEVRTPGRPFTYSAALCHVAVDRGARLAERLGLPADIAAWRDDAAQIRDAILTRAWSEELGAFAEHLDGGGGLDASLLALPLRRLVRGDDPRMVATAQAIGERLSAGGGLLHRYLPEVSPDGLPGHEGAFLLCSFWLVDNLTLQGRLDEALELYDALCGRANEVGLLPEQVDPASGAFLGNFPQAFSHVGLISSGVSLAAALARRR